MPIIPPIWRRLTTRSAKHAISVASSLFVFAGWPKARATARIWADHAEACHEVPKALDVTGYRQAVT